MEGKAIYMDGFVVVSFVFCSSFLFGKRWVMYVMLRYLQVVKA